MIRPAARSAAIAVLEQAINAALRLDPATRQRLATLQGKVILLQCTDPVFELFVLPHADRLALASVWDAPAHASLRGGADDFLRLATSDDPASELINGGLSLYGDSQSLQALQRIIRDLDLDWEKPLSRLLGDVAGHALGRALRQGRRRLGYAGRRLLDQGRDYLDEESGLLAARWEVTRFCDDVDKLAERVDRLDARLRRQRQRDKAVNRT